LDGVDILNDNNEAVFHKNPLTYETLNIFKRMYDNNELEILDGYLKGKLYFSNEQL
jgi:hypothetical protein